MLNALVDAPPPPNIGYSELLAPVGEEPRAEAAAAFGQDGWGAPPTSAQALPPGADRQWGDVDL